MSFVAPLVRAGSGFDRPYVISWNLTYRCNLACEHCYLDAGGGPRLKDDDAFDDRSELTTDECRGIVDQIAEFAPEALTILTGGEPLLRRDILEIVRHAHDRGLWVVVGTNGVRITANLAGTLKDAGVRGMALSLDAMDAARHDAFRRVTGAWENTVRGAKILHEAGLPFIVQTTVGAHNAAELEELAAFAHDEMGASVWNLYFLVPTGRGQFVSDMTPAEYDGVLATLARIQARWRGRMIANAKCAPHYVKTLLADDPGSPSLKSYAGGAGGCPAGTHYMGIRPNGDVTPCPYLPLFGGNLREQPLRALWDSSETFVTIRERNRLGGRCGECELSSHCGGCRARAWGMTGDLLAEDPLCTHTPGTFEKTEIDAAFPVEYGTTAVETVTWDPSAQDRMKRIPAFVRGMVVKRVEDHCRKNGITTVTEDVLTEIRSAMPTPKIFARRPPTT